MQESFLNCVPYHNRIFDLTTFNIILVQLPRCRYINKKQLRKDEVHMRVRLLYLRVLLVRSFKLFAVLTEKIFIAENIFGTINQDKNKIVHNDPYSLPILYLKCCLFTFDYQILVLKHKRGSSTGIPHPCENDGTFSL